MSFAAPFWLVVGLVACGLLIWLFRRANRARRASLNAFTAAHLQARLTSNVSPTRRTLKQVLWVLGVAMLFIALARPQWGYRWEEIRRRGIDIMIAMDTSKSMLAEDITPNRLVRSKLAITDLVEQLKGDRLGLIAFAGDSFLQCPLTLDHEAFLRALNSLDADIIPAGGSDIASAIDEAEEAFASQKQNVKILVLITDGEDLGGGALSAARAAAAQGMRIFTVGVGSTTGEIIPVRQRDGSVDFVKDAQGNIVKTKLDESTLQQVAEVSDGRYEPLGKRGEGLEMIYNEDLKTLPERELSSARNRVALERFQWPLGIALFCLMLELLITDRRRERRRKTTDGANIRPKHHLQMKKPKARGRSMAGTAPVLAALLFGATSTTQASEAASAQSAYERDQYEEAAALYEAAAKKNPDNPSLRYNLGAATYRSNNFQKAESTYGGLAATESPALRHQSLYNLGNALYRRGAEMQESDDKEGAMAKWEGALQAYEKALEIAPNDEQAQINYEFVRRKIEEMKQQQEQQQQDQQNQDQNQDQEKQDDQEQNQDQQNQDQQDQQNQDQQQQDQGQDQQDKNQDQQGKEGEGQQNQDQQQENQEQKDQDGKSGDQDQQKSDQGKQDEKKPEEGKDKQDQNQAGQDKNDEKKPADQKPGDEKKDEQGKDQQGEGKKPEPKPGEEEAGGGKAGEEDKSGQQTAQRVPGQMTKGEAENLLDAAEREEEGKATPIMLFYDGKPKDDRNTKDW